MNTHTTHIPEIRRLRRSRSDRMLAGVSGGLAEYFEIHPAVFRVGFVVLTLLGGAGLIIYAAAALVIPDEGKDDSIATAALRNRRERPWPLIGLGLLAVAGLALLSHVTLWPDGDAWLPFLLAGGLILWITRQRPTDTTTESAEQLAARDSRRLRRALKRTAIVLGTIVAVLLIAVASFAAAFHVKVWDGIGEQKYTVVSTQELRDDYTLGIGTLELDLGSLALPPGTTHLDASVDVGEVKVIVPSDVAVQVHGEAQAGTVYVLGRTDNGRNADVDLAQQGRRVLVLDAHVGAGSVRVERAVR